MPIWGDRQITWRQILPPAITLVALLCVALTLYNSWFPSGAKSEEFEFYMRQLGSADPAMVAAGIRLLGDFGSPKAIPAIRAKLESADPRLVGAACAALGKLGDQASAETLLRLLKHESPAAAAGAADGLGALRCKKAVEPLIALLGTSDAPARLAAIAALGQLGDPAAVQALQRLQADPCAGLNPQPPADQRARLSDTLREALSRLTAAK